MSRDDAFRLAQVDARTSGLVLAVVDAPIEEGEDETGPFGYCPIGAVPMLYRYGTPIASVLP